MYRRKFKVFLEQIEEIAEERKMSNIHIFLDRY
jgi:hypothetical protein